jgi:hypothetical protein
MQRGARRPAVSSASAYTLAARADLLADNMARHGGFALGDLNVELLSGHDSAWAVIRRPGKGGIALRLAFCPGGIDHCAAARRRSDEKMRLVIDSALGRHTISLFTDGIDLHRLRATVTLKPSSPLLVPFAPRDLYPIDERGDPLATVGSVEAAQRGMNSGLVYMRLDEPAFGSLLYFQNLTAMNDYYRATSTKPDGAVGGEWPELGYLMPTPPQSGTPPTDPLPAGTDTVISDAILVFRDMAPPDERESGRQFIQMLGGVYAALDRPEPRYHDWVGRAERTIKDLEKSPKATVRHYGHRYARPYTDAEYPDSMVQLALLVPLREFDRWRGKASRLDADFAAGLEKFYDPKLETLRRYLPNVGEDKDADAVDSWYLYHPLINLARLALAGDDKARDLLLRSIDFGIKAAHHFDYRWPIQYKVTDFSVITATAGADGRGQTDVGGLYAWIMLQCHELTQDERFLAEARAAIDAADGMRFHLNYQANLTAWGAAACLRLWRITNVDRYREQSYAYLASFFHNSAIWESDIDLARHYRNFLGVTALQDAPYMAVYECFDSFAAFEHYLRDSGPELEPAARMLVGEYCRYALDRAWFYYPDALPREALADEQRNGHIDRDLSFPVEDLYVDGQPAGQVGQEIYGAGAAMVFATRAFHDIEDVPLRIFCDHFITSRDRTGDRAVALQLAGSDHSTAHISVLRLPRRKLPTMTVMTDRGDRLRARLRSADRIEYHVPAGGRILLSWR